jgi:hypothetical protein
MRSGIRELVKGEMVKVGLLLETVKNMKMGGCDIL